MLLSLGAPKTPLMNEDLLNENPTMLEHDIVRTTFGHSDGALYSKSFLVGKEGTIF